MHTPFARHERKRRYIASKPNVLLHFLKKETNLALACDEYTCANPNLGEYLIQNFNAMELNWKALSKNKGLSQQTIAKNLSNFTEDISAHPSITWAFMEDNIKYKWNMHTISRNPNITMEFVESHIDYGWDYQSLSRNPNLTWKFIAAKKFRVTENWNWSAVAETADFTGFDVLAIEQMRDRTEQLCLNRSLTWETTFSRLLEKKLFWQFLSLNESVPLDIIYNSLSKITWRCDEMLRRSDITREFVEKHQFRNNIMWCSNPNSIESIEKDYVCVDTCTYGLRYNPAITIRLANKYFGATSFCALRCNQFLWDDTVYKREIAKDIAARRERLCGSESLTQSLKETLRDYGGLDLRGFGSIVMRYIDWE